MTVFPTTAPRDKYCPGELLIATNSTPRQVVGRVAVHSHALCRWLARGRCCAVDCPCARAAPRVGVRS
eukprot:8899214-Pyramimonas_sp.AAC.1